MGKLVKLLELDTLGPTFSRPSSSTYPYSNLWPMFNVSFFKISSAPLTSLHQPNYPQATWLTQIIRNFNPTQIPLTHIPAFSYLTPHDAPVPQEAIMEDWLLAFILNQEVWNDRATWGLIVKMAHYADLAKNKITVILETDQIAQVRFCFLTGVYYSKLWDHQIPDLCLHDHRSQLQAKN